MSITTPSAPPKKGSWGSFARRFRGLLEQIAADSKQRRERRVLADIEAAMGRRDAARHCGTGRQLGDLFTRFTSDTAKNTGITEQHERD
jgi:hypothetical protein